jgi:hypothetical protein
LANEKAPAADLLDRDYIALLGLFQRFVLVHLEGRLVPLDPNGDCFRSASEMCPDSEAKSRDMISAGNRVEVREARRMP